MTTYAFPSVTPSTTEIELISNTAAFLSPFSGAIQTLDRGGERWQVTMSFLTLSGSDRSTLIGFLGKLNGQQHRVTLPNHAEPQLGVLTGTPLVAGAGQTGTSLNIDGCTAGQTGWIKAGDWFSVNGELKMCVADANSDGGGNVTVSFIPRLRAAPADNAPLTVALGTGTFVLASNSIKWSNRPGPTHFSDLSVQFIEDIVA